MTVPRAPLDRAPAAKPRRSVHMVRLPACAIAGCIVAADLRQQQACSVLIVQVGGLESVSSDDVSFCSGIGR